MCCTGKFERTDLRRVIASQELQIVLEPLSAGDVRVRRVQPLVPPGSTVYVVVDPAERDVFSSKGYNFMPLPNGTTVEFPLGPQQTLAVACDGNAVVMGLIVEWFAGGAT